MGQRELRPGQSWFGGNIHALSVVSYTGRGTARVSPWSDFKTESEREIEKARGRERERVGRREKTVSLVSIWRQLGPNGLQVEPH